MKNENNDAVSLEFVNPFKLTLESLPTALGKKDERYLEQFFPVKCIMFSKKIESKGNNFTVNSFVAAPSPLLLIPAYKFTEEQFNTIRLSVDQLDLSKNSYTILAKGRWCSFEKDGIRMIYLEIRINDSLYTIPCYLFGIQKKTFELLYNLPKQREVHHSGDSESSIVRIRPTIYKSVLAHEETINSESNDDDSEPANLPF